MVKSALNVVFKTFAPYSWQEVDPVSGEKSFCGVTITLFLRIAKSLNMTVDLHRMEDGVWGNRLANGTYTGPLKMAHEGKTDLALGPYFHSTLTASELNAGFPHYRTKILVLSGCRSLYTTELSTAIFDLYVSLAIISSCLTVPLLLYFIQRRSGKSYSLLDAYEAIVSSFLQEPIELRKITTLSPRLLVIVWSAGCFIFMQGLSGVLRSHTAVKTPVKLIETFEQAISDHTLDIMLLAGTPTLDTLMEKRGGWVHQLIERVHRTNSLRSSMDEMFTDQCIGNIFDRKAIVIQDPETMLIRASGLCDKYRGFFHLSEKEAVEADLVWYYSPTLDAQTRTAISLRTMWTFETGSKWLPDRKLYPNAPKCFTFEARKVAASKLGEIEYLTLEQVLPFFYIILYGYIASAIVLSITMIRHTYLRCGKTNIRKTAPGSF